MNERIKELAKQALEETYRVMVDSCLKEAFDDFYNEKFAELIVRECGRVYIQNQQDGVMTLTQDLLQHFGVEE